MKLSKKAIMLIAIVASFLVLPIVYFSPILKGKVIQQHDVVTYNGAAKELDNYEKETGEYSQWTNGMFCGMPSYLIKMPHKSYLNFFNYIFSVDKEQPYMIVTMYFLFFFIAMLLLDIPILISVFGALAYGLSSYFFIIIEAGHITKAFALAYMPVVIAGVYSSYKGKHLIGALFFTLFLALQLKINHLQITYYTFLVLLLFILFQLYSSIKTKSFISNFIKPSIYLFIGVLIALATNFTNLYLTNDYGKYSTRGTSELTDNVQNKTTGLDKDYATAWSYGIDETFTLLIPNMKGGASSASLSTDSDVYKELESRNIPNAKSIVKNLPLYWGTQPFTSGPVYIGAIIFFLFIFGLLVVKGMLRWWILSATILSLFLAWGNNFMWFSDIFLDYIPGYNKFRTVSMILIIAEFTMPLLAVFALKEFVENIDNDEIFKKFKYSFYAVAGLLVLLLVSAGSLYSFSSESDAQLVNAGWPDFLVDAIRSDRESMLLGDIFRSLVFISLAFGALLLYKTKKLKINSLLLILIALIVFDMWSVNKRYLNNDDFITKRQSNEAYSPTQADLQILEDKDPDYRVMNLTVSTFNDATTSYFHKSIGGYHGAKMKRYQELIDKYISKMDMNVLNMLNTKYFIVPDQQTKQPVVQRNPSALGSVWFVNDIKIVENADAEMASLGKINTAQTAVVDKRYNNLISKTSFNTTNASIKLDSYKPNKLVYTSNSTEDEFAVFSEIYYEKGWVVTIDGKPAQHLRANYVLRAMNIPKGQHTIEFTFNPQIYSMGTIITRIASLLIFAGLLFVGYQYYKKRKESSTNIK